MKPMSEYIRNKNTILILIAIAALTASCSHEKQEASASMASGTPVRITLPKRMTLTETMDLNANTIFLKKEIVRATFQGFIQKINKNIGDKVKPGDLLFQMRTKESASADSLNLHLGNEIFRGSVIIRARSEGILTALNYTTGDFVSDGEEIAIISNPSSLRISLNVPYYDVSKINPHEKCEIFLPNGKKLWASIQRVIPSVDPASQTQTFLLQPIKAIALPENLNVTARMRLRTIKNAIALPLSAIMSNETQDKFWIMKLINDTTAVHIDIGIGIENDSLVQIINPQLSLADRIISEGAYGLPDTAKVQISR
jgi:multidrug efflux pump subunit AcrA (membrane-fusion protein)